MENYKLKKLQNGETFETSEKGNSMSPLIKSGEKHTLKPTTWEECKKGDVVYCKIKGKFMTHLVKAKSDKGLLISNYSGYENGWTKLVYGKVIW